MTSSNQHISEFLNYYCQLNKPEYAVLLNGAWGIGKTHFIDDFIKKQSQNNLKFYKVSLFGLKSLQELNSEIFSSIHPKIGSKKAQLVYRTLFSVLPRINLSSELGEDAEGSLKLDVSALADQFGVDGEKSGAKRAVFIFDDLERTDIPLREILGFLNRYVEFFGQKVIIIANENEIGISENEEDYPDTEKVLAAKNSTVYQVHKEKLVGKSFSIEPQAKSAIQAIIKELGAESISEEVAQKVFNPNESKIIKIFKESSYKNLRHIKHGLKDFSRLYDKVGDNVRAQKDVISKLLITQMVLTIEKREGKISEKQLEALDAHSYSLSKEIYSLFNKYSEFNLREILLNGKVWKDVIFHSKLNGKDINTDLNVLMLSKAELPEWQKLWWFRKLSNIEFKGSLEVVSANFFGNRISNICELIQVLGMLIFFSSKELLNKSHDEILKGAYENYNKNKEKILSSFKKEDFVGGRLSCDTYQIHSSDNEAILALVNKIKDDKTNFNITKAAGKINLAFDKIEEDITYFKSVAIGYFSDPILYKSALLSLIDTEKFIDILLNKISPNSRWDLMCFISDRLTHDGVDGEVEWGHKLSEKLKIELEKNSMNGVEKFALSEWCSTLEKI